MNWKKGLGIGLIFIGLYMALIGGAITGAVIGTSPKNYLSMVGILAVIVGGVLILVEEMGELEIKAIKLEGPGRRTIDSQYAISDPTFYFSSHGFVSLGDFKELVSTLKEDEDTFDTLRRKYTPLFERLHRSTDNYDKAVGKEFLAVLYAGDIPSGPKEIVITNEERNEIQSAFNPGWYGEPDQQQGKILSKYDLAFIKKSGHGEIHANRNPNLSVSVSSTPSDINAGKNVGRDITRLVIKDREDKKSKKNSN